MSFLLSVISGLKIFSPAGVTDDFTDRLHYQVSTGLLVAFSILVSFKQFGGKPMECMVPETFSGPWEEYAEQYCFAMNTYYLPMHKDVVTTSIEDRTRKQINYYQWVPFILIIEAAMFQVPFMAWKVLGHHSGLVLFKDRGDGVEDGIRLHDLVDDAADKKNLDPATRAQTITMLKTHLENALKFHRCLNLPYTSSYVSMMFLTSKFLYLLNATFQFFLMNRFLETSTEDAYGWGTIYEAWTVR